jgi:ribosomal protein L16 Arg81 hydroxylase
MIDFGMTSADFRGKYFERNPHLFRQALGERPFAWPDLDTLLQQNEPTPQGLQLFNRGLIGDETYTEDCSGFGLRRRRLNKVRFYGHLNAGATLVINRFELQSVAAQRLCAEVARFAAQPATSNAYVSFRGDGTFGKHWDTHDVFAIQLIGRKRWRIFAPTLPLPLGYQTSERSEQRCPETPVFECVLEAGDILYIPRGWWHLAIPLDEGSLHLSVGTYAATVHDYVMWVCSRVLPDDVRAREAFQGGSPAMLAAILERVSAAVCDPKNRSEFQQQIEQRERTTSQFNLGLFADPHSQPLSAATRVRLNTCYTRTSTQPLMVNGVALQLDPLSAHLVTLLSGSPAPTIAELERQVPSATAEAIRGSVMNLSRYELVTLELC